MKLFSKTILIFSLAFPCLLLPNDQLRLRTTSDLNSLFSSATGYMESGSADAAIRTLQEWKEKASALSILSPEVHHNLAAAYAETGDYVSTSKELLEATRLWALPFRRIEELRHLREVQRLLGISHSTLERPTAILLLSISREVTLSLLLAAIWAFILFQYLRITRRRTYKILPIMGMVFLIALLSIQFANRFFGSLGILDGANEIPVYSNSNLNEKIITLPPGTLVRIRRNQKESRQILEPIYGWVKSEECFLTPLPTSVGLST